MQARKLIRLLNEIIEKNPSMKYAEICVDLRYGRNSDLTYKAVSDVEIKQVDIWNEQDTNREVIVIGNY